MFENKIERKKLKMWIQLEDLKSKLYQDFSNSNFKSFSETIIQYLNIAYDLEDSTMLADLPWWEIAGAFEKAKIINIPKLKIPMIMTRIKKDGVLEKSYAWDYPERTWYVFLNQFSRNYSWTIEYIENLDVDDAIALLQEMNITEQLEREFYYSLSEIAYPYNEARKVGVFKPMERPEWMREFVKVLEPRKTKIRKSFMPVGLIIGSKQNDTQH